MAATTGSGDWAVQAEGLVKRFGKVTAVNGVDLRIARGGVFGILGPNGAGKTTTIRMLAALSRPNEGWARVFGRDVATEGEAVRSRIALTGQYASVDEDLTGLENLILLARLLGYSRPGARERAMELLGGFGLQDAAGRQVKNYSGGMRRRIDIAASLVVTPDLLFLDEPTTGLDPRSRTQVWDIVRTLVAAGTTVLLTTQYLDEADALADRIAVIDHGRVIAEGTSAELKASVGEGALRLRVSDPALTEAARAHLSAALGVEVVAEREPGVVSARADDPGAVARAVAGVIEAGIAVSDFSLGQPSLDEVFMTLTGRPAEPAPEDESDQGEEAA